MITTLGLLEMSLHNADYKKWLEYGIFKTYIFKGKIKARNVAEKRQFLKTALKGFKKEQFNVNVL